MIDLTVNGAAARVDVDPATPLLYVLRDDLHLHAAKFGCGLGQCGACTVLVDDRPVFSCLVPVGAIGTRKVTTVEGLGTAAKPGDVQRAFLHEQAARTAMAPSLCRCGTHMRILRAVRRAAVMRGGGVVDAAEPVT
jgi:nicotinate dehydrogenase subunit A